MLPIVSLFDLLTDLLFIEITPTTVDHDIEPPGNVPFFDVFELLYFQVLKLIMSSTKKSCCLDPMPTVGMLLRYTSSHYENDQYPIGIWMFS